MLFSVQVTDRSGTQSGEFTDLSKVEKFEISDDAYEKRAGNPNIYNNSISASNTFAE